MTRRFDNRNPWQGLGLLAILAVCFMSIFIPAGGGEGTQGSIQLSIKYRWLLKNPDHPATRVFEDGLESGSISKWSAASTPNPQVTSGSAHNGSYKAVLASGQWTYKALWSGYDRLSMRAYVQFKSFPASGSESRILGVWNTGLTRYMAEASIANVSGTLKWKLRYYDNGAHYTATSEQQVNPSLNTWYCVEVEGISSSTANAGARVYVNGYELTDIAQTGKNNDAQMNSGYLQVTGSAVNIWYDCVAIDTAYIGPETGTGDYSRYLGSDSIKVYLWWLGVDYGYDYAQWHGWCDRNFTTPPTLNAKTTYCEWDIKTASWNTSAAYAGTLTYMIAYYQIASEQVLVEDSPGSGTFHPVAPLGGVSIWYDGNNTQFYLSSPIYSLGTTFTKDYPFYSDRVTKVMVTFDVILTPRLIDVVPSGEIDIYDLRTVAHRYGLHRGDPGWTQLCEDLVDIDNCCTIDIYDLRLIGLNYEWNVTEA